MADKSQRALRDLQRWEEDAVLLLVRGELPLMSLPQHLLVVPLSPAVETMTHKQQNVYKRK